MKIETYTYNNIKDLFLYKLDKESFDNKIIQLKSELKFFNPNDFDIPSYCSERYNNSVRFVIVHNDIDILGLCKLSSFDSSDNELIINFMCVNSKYQKQGISKLIVNEVIHIKIKEFNDLVLVTSEWCSDGLKFIRPYLIKACEKNNILFIDSELEY